jgi:hypothetical protein
VKQFRLQTCALLLASLSVLTIIPYAEAVSCTTYQPFFDAVYAANATWMDGQAASGNGAVYYSFSYILGGTLAMFEGTKNTKYLDTTFRWAETMIAAARIVDDHGKKNWAGTWLSPWADARIAYMLEDLQASTELARLARITLTDATLSGTYGPRAQKVYRFVKDHVVDKWLFTRDTDSWFLGIASDESKFYSDKVTFIVRLLLDLQRIDGNTTYASLAAQLLEEFKNRLAPHSASSLIWDLPVAGNAPDTSHANRIPYMLSEAYDAGMRITSKEIDGVSNLLTGVIWDRSTSSPRFTNFIDGNNDSVFGRPAWGNGQIYSGWVTLGAYDADVQRVARSTLDAIISGARNASLDYMRSVYGKIALAGFITRNMRIADTCR